LKHVEHLAAVVASKTLQKRFGAARDVVPSRWSKIPKLLYSGPADDPDA